MTQDSFDQQLQLVREGLDKRAARQAVCAALGRLSRKKFIANERFTNGEVRKWIKTEEPRIEKEWGTKIADWLVANRDLYTKFQVQPLRPEVCPDAAPDTLFVWPKRGQINRLLKLGKRWGADEYGTHKVGGQTVVHFWWD